MESVEPVEGEVRPELIFAPFRPEQVTVLNEFQALQNFHPFTCGSGNRTDEHHLDGEGVLRATETGWECPYCDYRQEWALGFMADPQAVDAIRQNDPRRLLETPNDPS